MRFHRLSILGPWSRVFLFAGLALAWSVVTARADLYWDINGATPGAGGTSPTGAWDAATTNWSADSTGTSATAAWAAGQIAVFAAGGDATLGYTVTVSGTQVIGGLRIEEGSPNVTGGVLSFNGPVTLARPGGGDVPINSLVQGNGLLTASAAANFLRLNGVMSDSGGALSLRLTGGGGIVLGGQHTYSGDTTVDGATAIPLVDSVGSATTSNLTSGPFGRGTLVLVSGTLRPGSGSGGTIGNAVTLAGNFTFGTADSTRTITLNGPITLTGDRTLTFNNAPAVFSGALGESGGSFGFTKAGSQALTLSGVNNFSGTVNVSGGTLIVRDSSALGTTAGGTAVANGATLRLENNVTVSGESLSLNGGGAGGAGALRNESGNNSWTGLTTLASGTTITSNSGTLTLGDVSLGASGLTVRGGGNVTISGLITGSGGVSRTDSGILTLANNGNTFAGNVSASHGVISVASIADSGVVSALGTGNTINLGQGTFNPSDTGTLRYTGPTASTNRTITMTSNATGPSGRPTIEVTNSAATLTFGGNFQYAAGSTAGVGWILTGAGNGVINGNITTTDAGLTKQGTGTWTLAGNNTYKGLTTVAAGALRIQSATGLGTTDAGATVTSGARLELAGNVTVSGESITIDGDGGNFFGALQSASGNNVWDGPVIVNGGNTRVAANTGTLEVRGVIQNGTGNTVIVRNNTGTTIFSGANTYTGNTLVYNGTLRIDLGDDRLPVGTNLILGVNGPVSGLPGFFDLNGRNQTVAGLDDAGLLSSAVTNAKTGTTSTFTVNNTGNFTYDALITNAAGATLNLAKQGGGTLALTNANTYTGTTDVQGGTLSLSHATSNNTIAGSPVVRVALGATLDVSGLAGAADLILASGQTLKGNGTVLGNLSVPLGATIAAGDSPGHLIQTGNYTQAGTMDVEILGRTQGVTYDWIDVSGTALVDGLVKVTLGGGFVPESGDAFDVLTASGVTVGPSFSIDGTAGPLLPAQYWSWRIAPYGTGGQQALELFVAVPEPASLGLLGLGALAWLAWTLRRRRAA